MLLEERDFARGVQGAFELREKEKARQWNAITKAKSMMMRRTSENEEEFQRTLDEAEALPPLWQRVCGFSPRSEMGVEPAERRAGIRRLLRVVERMFRVEVKSEDLDAEGGPSKLEGGDVSFAGRSNVWEPLNEICVYLEISKSKLNALSVQRTGLRATDICDCIRVEGLRNRLRDKFRPLVTEWLAQMTSEQEQKISDDFENSAWKFLKWMRGGGRGETRKKLAFELGMTSRERLDRAALVAEGEAIEAIEVLVAMKVIRMAVTKPFGAPRGVEDLDWIPTGKSSHGAGCDEVRDGGKDGPPPEELDERETA